MTPKRFLILAMGLLLAAVASALAPAHPVYNPPVGKFVLTAFAFTALMFGMEARRWPQQVYRDLYFAVSFDDQVIRRANPDGTTDSARWCDLERISIEPYDDPQLWIGPYFVDLTFRSGPLSVPAWAEGRGALMERLLELPGIDRDRVEALTRGENPTQCVIWMRDKGTGAARKELLDDRRAS
jgi:hypothetical protein